MTQAFSDATPCGKPADTPESAGAPSNGGLPHFDWAALAPKILHEDKVAIIEALAYVDLPMSALDLHRILDNGSQRALSHTAYHVRALADLGVIAKVSQRQRRGATQKFYVLR